MERRRVLAAVGIALVGTLVVIVAALAGDRGSHAAAPPVTARPIARVPPLLLDDLPARYALPASNGRLAALRRLGDPARDPQLALALASAAIDADQPAAARSYAALARARLGVGDVRVAVADALLRFDPKHPERAADTLQAIAADRPKDPFPLFERGLVLLYGGHTADAQQVLTSVRQLAPDSRYGVAADNLLHPGERPGYPFWLPDQPLPTGTLASLERRAAAHPDRPDLQLAVAVLLQQAGRRTEALAAAQRAEAADPSSLEAHVAIAVLGFDKDNPARSVGALGKLHESFPAAASPLFHMGLMLTWIEQPAQAKIEFAKAARLEPRSPVGRTAALVLSRLKK
jgi:tetratricopeptide (TPR) repeat protein